MAQATIDRDRATIAKLQASLEGISAERDKATAAAVHAANHRDQISHAFTTLRMQAAKLQELAVAHEQRATTVESLRAADQRRIQELESLLAKISRPSPTYAAVTAHPPPPSTPAPAPAPSASAAPPPALPPTSTATSTRPPSDPELSASDTGFTSAEIAALTATCRGHPQEQVILSTIRSTRDQHGGKSAHKLSIVRDIDEHGDRRLGSSLVSKMSSDASIFTTSLDDTEKRAATWRGEGSGSRIKIRDYFNSLIRNGVAAKNSLEMFRQALQTSETSASAPNSAAASSRQTFIRHCRTCVFFFSCWWVTVVVLRVARPPASRLPCRRRRRGRRGP